MSNFHEASAQEKHHAAPADNTIARDETSVQMFGRRLSRIC